MANVVDNEELFNVIVVAGVSSPGQVTLSNHDRKQKYDVKPADGHGGGSMTYKGEEVSQFSSSFYLVKDPAQEIDDYAQWDTFAAMLRASLSGGKAKALDIYHPDLAENDIKSACVAKIGGKVYDGKGGATVAVDWTENRPPKKKAAAPSGSKASAKAPDPNADLKAQIAALTQQAAQP